MSDPLNKKEALVLLRGDDHGTRCAHWFSQLLFADFPMLFAGTFRSKSGKRKASRANGPVLMQRGGCDPRV
jgi:hypothetical protein